MKTRILVGYKPLGHFINIQTLGCEGEEVLGRDCELLSHFLMQKWGNDNRYPLVMHNAKPWTIALWALCLWKEVETFY